MKRKTLLAIGELIQAAAHSHGVVGPVEFTVLTERGHSCPQKSQSDVPDLRAEHFTDAGKTFRRAIRRTPGRICRASVFVVEHDLFQAVGTFPGKGKSHPNAFFLKGIPNLLW